MENEEKLVSYKLDTPQVNIGILIPHNELPGVDAALVDNPIFGKLINQIMDYVLVDTKSGETIGRSDKEYMMAMAFLANDDEHCFKSHLLTATIVAGGEGNLLERVKQDHIDNLVDFTMLAAKKPNNIGLKSLSTIAKEQGCTEQDLVTATMIASVSNMVHTFNMLAGNEAATEDEYYEQLGREKAENGYK